MINRKLRGLIASVIVLTMLVSACSTSSDETTADVSAEATTIVSEETTEEATEATEETTEATEETTAGPTNTPTPTITPTPFPVNPNTPELEGYNILWCDEFDGDTLNEGLWLREARRAGYTNNELQRYDTSDDNIYVADGCLNLRAYDLGDEYTSGKVTSHAGGDFLYGRIEVCAKVPEGQGLWPAIWMMPSKDNRYGNWPACGEIDIMEILGHQTHLTYSNIHYGNPHGDQQGAFVLPDGQKFSDDFHVYGCEWEPGEIRFYIDGQLFHTVNDWFSSSTSTLVRPYPAPFNQQFYLILNLAVGGDWPGDPDETTNFDEAIFQIDYVRVYQKDEYDENVTRPEVVLREADETGNYIMNGDLSDETDSFNDDTAWKINLSNQGAAEASIADGVVTMDIENSGNVDYGVQLLNCAIPLENGCDYKLTFDIRAEEDRTAVVGITAPRRDYIRYLEDTTMDITADWQSMEYEFTMTGEDDAFARLEFAFGANESTANVQIRNVRLEKVQ